jgi:GNAT superfamily N-acetyltransferase
MIECSSTVDYSEAVAYLREDVLTNIGLLNSLERDRPPVPRQVWVARAPAGRTAGVMVLEEMPHGRHASLHARSAEGVEALLRCLDRNKTYPIVVCGAVGELLRAVLPKAQAESTYIVMTLARRDLCQVEPPGEIRRLTPADKALTDVFPSPRPTLTDFVQWAANDPHQSVVFALIVGREIVSFVQFGEDIDEYWQVGDIRTRPDRTRRGFAKALLAKASAELLAGGRTPLYDANDENVASIRTAEAVGFRERYRRYAYKVNTTDLA